MCAAKAIAAAVLTLSCAASHTPSPTLHASTQVAKLRAEVQRLTIKVHVLEQRLQQEQKHVARTRLAVQEQRERIVALESQSPSQAAEPAPQTQRANIAATIEAQAELRQAYQTLMRAIERMDISAEEKAALKSSLRPTRTLDNQNPWSSAQK